MNCHTSDSVLHVGGQQLSGSPPQVSVSSPQDGAAPRFDAQSLHQTTHQKLLQKCLDKIADKMQTQSISKLSTDQVRVQEQGRCHLCYVLLKTRTEKRIERHFSSHFDFNAHVQLRCHTCGVRFWVKSQREVHLFYGLCPSSSATGPSQVLPQTRAPSGLVSDGSGSIVPGTGQSSYGATKTTPPASSGYGAYVTSVTGQTHRSGLPLPPGGYPISLSESRYSAHVPVSTNRASLDSCNSRVPVSFVNIDLNATRRYWGAKRTHASDTIIKGLRLIHD